MEKRKQIVISNYDDVYNPDYAGGGAAVINKLAALLSKEYNVSLITGRYPGSRNEIVNKVKYIRIGSYALGGRFGHLFYLLALPFVCLRENYDLWIDSFTPPFSVSPIPLFVKKNKVIGLVHMLSGKDMKRKYKIPFDVIEHYGLRLYKNIIVLTDFSKNEILNSNPKANVYVIPNGINTQKGFNLNVKKRDQILFIGRIEVNQKGLDLLLQSYKKVSDEINLSLVIAGTGLKSEVEKLKTLIKTLKLTGKVKLLGRVEGDVKTKLIRESLMIIVPSRFETFSMSALEALVSKTVLVSFDIDGMKWIPKGVSKKISMFNIDRMAEGIIEISKNASLRKIYQENGYKFVKQYYWENIISKYHELINNITH